MMLKISIICIEQKLFLKNLQFNHLQFTIRVLIALIASNINLKLNRTNKLFRLLRIIDKMVFYTKKPPQKPFLNTFEAELFLFESR